jgi:hypothetical protein
VPKLNLSDLIKEIEDASYSLKTGYEEPALTEPLRKPPDQIFNINNQQVYNYNFDT